jgi:hypothetical protein
MKLGCLVVWVAAGCNAVTNEKAPEPPLPPPPVATAMTPTSGPFGTSVTIDGTDFGAAQGDVTFDACTPIDPAEQDGLEVTSWTDTEIIGRVSFPCTGALTVHTQGGASAAGTFTTAMPWNPGPGIAVTTLVTKQMLPGGTIAAIYRSLDSTTGAALAVFDGEAATSYELDNIADPTDLTSPIYARIAVADDGTPMVVATQNDNQVVIMTTAGGTLATAPIGISGQVFAAGRDATGVFAWIDSGGMVRARPGASGTAWAIDRGPFVPAFQPLDGAVAADGTLWISFSEPNDDPFDHEAYISLQSLAPTATALSAIERADPNSYDDVISQAHIVLADDGVHMVVVAFAKDNGTGLESYEPALMRTAASTWSDVPLLADVATVPSYLQYVFSGTTLGVVVTDQGSQATTLVPDLSMPVEQMIPVWPATAEGVVADGAGTLHPLVTTGTVAFAISQP